MKKLATFSALALALCMPATAQATGTVFMCKGADGVNIGVISQANAMFLELPRNLIKKTPPPRGNATLNVSSTSDPSKVTVWWQFGLGPKSVFDFYYWVDAVTQKPMGRLQESRTSGHTTETFRTDCASDITWNPSAF